MNHDAPVIEPFCLDCGYDLAGLPGARCPECGTDFDRDRIGHLLVHQPIRTGEAVARVLIAPGLLVGMIVVAFVLGSTVERMPEFVAVVAWVFATSTFVWGIVSAVHVARRLAWNRAIRRRRSPYYRNNLLFINLLSCGLFGFQVFAFVSGCFCTLIGLSQLRLFGL